MAIDALTFRVQQHYESIECLLSSKGMTDKSSETLEEQSAL